MKLLRNTIYTLSMTLIIACGNNNQKDMNWKNLKTTCKSTLGNLKKHFTSYTSKDSYSSNTQEESKIDLYKSIIIGYTREGKKEIPEDIVTLIRLFIPTYEVVPRNELKTICNYIKQKTRNTKIHDSIKYILDESDKYDKDHLDNDYSYRLIDKAKKQNRNINFKLIQYNIDLYCIAEGYIRENLYQDQTLLYQDIKRDVYSRALEIYDYVAETTPENSKIWLMQEYLDEKRHDLLVAGYVTEAEKQYEFLIPTDIKIHLERYTPRTNSTIYSVPKEKLELIMNIIKNTPQPIKEYFKHIGCFIFGSKRNLEQFRKDTGYTKFNPESKDFSYRCLNLVEKMIEGKNNKNNIKFFKAFKNSKNRKEKYKDRKEKYKDLTMREFQFKIGETLKYIKTGIQCSKFFGVTAMNGNPISPKTS